MRVTVESRLSGAKAALTLKTTYEIVGNGEIAVAGLRGRGELPPLPRVGFQLQLPGTYDTPSGTAAARTRATADGRRARGSASTARGSRTSTSLT